MAVKTKVEKRSLRYDFNASEIHDLSLQLAKKNQEVQSLEDEKKAVTSQLSAKINEAKASVNKLSGQVSDGWEYRDIECDVLYHTPVQGKKTIVRRDNGKKTAVESMTDAEWNLFNQPDEEEDHDKEPETVDGEYEEAGSEESGPKLLGN